MPDQPGPARLERCAGCGRELAPAAAFCASCGRATRAGVYAVGERAQGERERARRGVLAVVAVVAGVLGLLFAASRVAWRDLPLQLALEAGLFAVGFAAVAIQGGDAWRASLAGPTRARGAALGALLGALAFAITLAWVRLMRLALGDGEPSRDAAREPLALVLAVAVVLAPLVEEWLCRGVLWQALARHASRAGTVALTALVFALLHGLGGGAWLEIPHRFAFGVIVGFLRARSGSLGPCVIAHATHNLLAATRIA